MFKRIFSLFVVVLILLCGIGVGMLISRDRYMGVLTRSYTDNKLNYTMAIIENMYVDSVNMDTLTEKILPKMLSELDPHSVYIPQKEMSGANETLDGEFDGIGIMFNMATDTVIVLSVINLGPSDKAGVQNGDRIIKIDDELVAGVKVPQSDIMKKLRGKRGTYVNLAIERKGIDELVDIRIERDKIPIKSLDAAFMLTKEIGFVKLSAFSRTSFSEVTEAILGLREQGMTKLIFDLRGNSGGFLDQAINIANEFLPVGSMIVYTMDRSGRKAKEFSDNKGKSKDLELVMLIDEASASSSEILAGAVQDNDRGLVIGRRSYGKGLVQQQIAYGDGSAIRLTVARYYTPTGRSIQKPYDKGVDAYQRDLMDRYMHNEFFSADSIKFADTVQYITPKGKVLYGGGGIMPDVFVPMDTTGVTNYFTQVSGRNILYKFTLKYSDDHRKQLNKIKTLEDLNSFFNDDDKLFDEFVAYASAQGVKANKKELKESKELITIQLKAIVGRNTSLLDVAYYSAMLPIDNILLRAIQELE